MSVKQLKDIIFPVATLSGTIIGVGIFSLPYITFKAGFWIVLAYFLVLGIVVTSIHLFFGELALRTPDFKRLPGFVKFHLGNWAGNLSYVSVIIGLLGALLAYLIVGGEFLEALLSPIFGGNNLPYTFLYFVLGALTIFLGIKAIAKIEFWGLISFFIVLILMYLRGKNFINIDNLFPPVSDIFLPYGPILFSLWGATLIPEAEEMMGENKKLMPKVLVIATLIPLIVYLFFIYFILGITGNQTTESALIGLRNSLGNGIVNLGFLFGLLTTFTSFIALGLTLKNIFWYDLKIPKNIAWFVTCLPPFILFLIGMRSFIPVISFLGGIMLGIDGILILLMYRKIKPKQILIYPLFLILLGGIIYELIYFIR